MVLTRWGRVRRWAAAIAVSAAAFATTATTTSQEAAAVPERDWLHVQGNRIVDLEGNRVWLTGANWFGFNASERVFHGLWSANITELTAAIAQRGINIVRVPISTQLLLEWRAGQTVARPNVNTFANPELANMNNLQIWDFWLALCERFGIKVMLDVHSAEADNSGHIYPMWFKGTITSEQFYTAWEWVTQRYRDNDTIVAMDIKNEPHGTPNSPPRAKWDGSTDTDNFKNACQVAGRRILAINPNLLILCEGIEVYPRPGETWNSPNTDPDLSPNYFYNWWGGNLRGVRDFPVDLGANQDQLVYSPHDYGPLVFNQPWFQVPFTKATLTTDVWRPNWLYIHEENIAPLLIGEWGGRLGQDERQDRWMTALRDLIVDEGLHQTFWVINPNSGDTGGLLLDDWRTWDEQKYNLLRPALWQFNNKFVGLDHQVRLGGAGSTTGINLAERYGSGPIDSTAPSTPTGLTVTGTTSASVSLSWNAATDNVGVTGYQIFRNGAIVNTAPGTSFTDTGLAGGTTYTYTVRARDAAGNTSAASTAATGTTQPGGGGGNSGCTATYRSTNNWDGGFQGEVTVTNTGTAQIRGWSVALTLATGRSISNVWNGNLTGTTVTNAGHNGALAPTASTNFGFVANGQSTDAVTVASCTTN
ncbi:MAG TPA: cellulase family glycosylhydrolase [Actinophytocola sp.]|uniref:cellulase family glycosylhydrolase n=1 Tax=Actinophytocola sp. TaxID=1872138 RepID=UPI002DBD3B24|nr:cellulase family glycosylhydrolase [Actinophytocola sp.]HEU5471059.1 cellulase family glycosylhydrolase [Actinophytocola sp.]